MIKETKEFVKLNGIVIKLFGKAIPSVNTISFSSANKKAVQKGYLLHPDVCTEDVLSCLPETPNYNATFYKKWESIISKSRFELFEDQILHYLSTYGTNYNGVPYIPEENSEVPPFTDLKVITSITEEEVIERCLKMLSSGISLKGETIADILYIFDEFNFTPSIGDIKNKEAAMAICKKTGLLPISPVEMVRYIVYLATGDTLLIKSKGAINKIKLNKENVDLPLLVSRFGYEKLATVFFRFKPIFLALKNYKNSSVVNKLRKLANKHHKALVPGFFETILSTPNNIHLLEEKLTEISNFKKVLLLETILIRQKQMDIRAFVVRNQKLFIKEEVTKNKEYYTIIWDIIYKSLTDSLSKKSCKINLPTGINITLPTSEKSFIGNYPIGTSFDMSDSDAIIGINWREEDGARDLDLKLIDTQGNMFGWNAHYNNGNNSIIYSGDMTSADPEATELFYASNGFLPSIVKVNLFNGIDGSKFRFFIAKEKYINKNRNYMVDPNNILFTIDCKMDSKEQTLGIITDNKFVVSVLRTGDARISGSSITNKYTEWVLETSFCHLSLEKVLIDSGFQITNENPLIDLTSLSKDSLISLLS